jgi:hypothetical protein
MVMRGIAPDATQYQLPLHDAILDGLFDLAPQRSANWFAIVYFFYYSTGLILFFEQLYRLCHRHAGVLASCAAVLYYVALMPLLWHDSVYHPSDPWGALVTVWLVGKLFDPAPTVSYHGILLVSGFVWDKSVFFPFSRAVGDWLAGRRKGRILLELALGCLLAGLGQAFYRWCYGQHAAGVGSLSQNVRYFYIYLFGLLVFQGPAIYYFCRNYRRLRVPFLGLLLQTPAWFLLYLALNGCTWEYRASFFVSVTYCAPLLAMLCDEWREELDAPEKAIPATEAPSASTQGGD